jgi:hypothetical protein
MESIDYRIKLIVNIFNNKLQRLIYSKLQSQSFKSEHFDLIHFYFNFPKTDVIK